MTSRQIDWMIMNGVPMEYEAPKKNNQSDKVVEKSELPESKPLKSDA